jgi:hypothetical protein
MPAYRSCTARRRRSPTVDIGKPTYIYHLGDFDPSGVNAGEKIEQTLKELAPKADITFRRIGVALEQIRYLELPTRPTKASDTRSKGFGNVSVELDAIPPDQLRRLVEQAIERHLPQRQFEILKIAEESERPTRPLVSRCEVGLSPQGRQAIIAESSQRRLRW